MSWHNESRRHSLASKGVKTAIAKKPLMMGDSYEKPTVYPIYKIQQADIILNNKVKKEAIKELKEKGYPYHVYFQTPFQFRFIGTNTIKDAKKVYNKIMTDNKDLYGCIVSVETTN